MCLAILADEVCYEMVARVLVDMMNLPVRSNVTPVFCGSSASVRSLEPACPYRVPASSPTSLHCSLFGLKSASTALRARRSLFVYPCRSDLVAVEVELLETASCPDSGKHSTTSACDLCLRVAENQTPLTVSGQRLLVRVSPLLQAYRGIPYLRVYVRDSLLFSAFNFSRDYRSCRAHRSLPEVFKLVRRPWRSSPWNCEVTWCRNHGCYHSFVFRLGWKRGCSIQLDCQELNLLQILVRWFLPRLLTPSRASWKWSPQSQVIKEFGVDMGRAATETKHTEVLHGGGSGGGGLPRPGGHAPAHCILHSHHEYPRDITAPHETEVREDLAALPGVSGSVDRHAREYPLLHCGHLRGLRWVSVIVTGDLDASSIGRSERLHATLRQINGVLEPATKIHCSGCPTPTPEQASTDHPPKFQQSSRATGKRLGSSLQSKNTWNWPLLGLSQPGARSDVPVVRQAIQVRLQGQGNKGAKAKRRRGKLGPGRDPHDAGPAHPRGRARQFRATSKWVALVFFFFALMSSFFQRNRVHEFCQRGDRHSSFPLQL